MKTMISRIIFAAGGTGGHIYPAIAIADELRKLNDKIEIKFIGAKGRIEEKIIPLAGYKLETIKISGFKRNLSVKNFLTAYKILKALKTSAGILKDFKPELVYGTGGFVSGPVLRSAIKLNIPSVIEEGNYYPGVTVKLISPKADKVIVNFEGTKQFLKRKDNAEVMSYPVRENLKNYDRTDAVSYFGFDASKKILFVFGGSQGAQSINTALLKCIKNICGSGIQVIWQTGDKDFESISKTISGNKNVKVLRYINNIDKAYSAADLIVCRSGISTIMELAAFGLAAIFVPFPLASENHQEKNAKAIVEKHAAEMIRDNELNEKFESTILSLINDDNKLVYMKNNIKQFADQKAASKIAAMLIDLVSKSKN
ncbi:MAG: undecaprenyldiphospho-muramoylpentapeptide beta-N-acetylglucosaminyltransferase [Ignavibacteria bacterium]|nr:undecaprenyldiphospho-muramoylpentapeptide beta-N-acetylglucosaminyltransferase [Ignavibacteria bacterium]